MMPWQSVLQRTVRDPIMVLNDHCRAKKNPNPEGSGFSCGEEDLNFHGSPHQHLKAEHARNGTLQLVTEWSINCYVARFYLVTLYQTITRYFSKNKSFVCTFVRTMCTPPYQLFQKKVYVCDVCTVRPTSSFFFAVVFSPSVHSLISKKFYSKPVSLK